MDAPRRIALAAAALALLSRLAAATSAKPPIAGCGVVTGPSAAPQIRLQTPTRGDAVRRQGRGASAGAGPTIVVPGPPVPPWPACAGDIGAAVSGDAIVPGAIGIAMNLLGDGFHLASVTLGAACVSEGSSPAAVPLLETSWTVDGSDASLALSQQPKEDPSASRLDAGHATFWWQGYVYDLSISGVVPLGSGTAGGAVPGGGSGDTQQVLLHAIAELAPGLDLSCFATPTTGTWSDLAALGIGDPRPAIPSAYALAGFQLTYLSAPACGAPPPANAELSLFASFQSAAGGSIAIDAWSLGGSAPYPGSIQDGLVTWSSDLYQFSVSGGTGDGSPLPASVLVPIAAKLDPAFSPACMLRDVTLTAADLPELGFHAAAAPPGYATTESSLTGNVVDPSCPVHYDFGGTYSLYWAFGNPEGLVVTASALRVVSDHPGPRTAPLVSDSCISWSDDLGTSFFVWGGSAAGSAGPDGSVLAAVAKSMDPGLALP